MLCCFALLLLLLSFLHLSNMCTIVHVLSYSEVYAVTSRTLFKIPHVYTSCSLVLDPSGMGLGVPDSSGMGLGIPDSSGMGLGVPDSSGMGLGVPDSSGMGLRQQD